MRPSPRTVFVFALALAVVSPAWAISPARKAGPLSLAERAPKAHPSLLARLESGEDSIPVIVALKMTAVRVSKADVARSGDPDQPERARRLAAEKQLAIEMGPSAFAASGYFENVPFVAGLASHDGAIALANRADVEWVALDGTKKLFATSPANQPMQQLVRSPRSNSLGFTGAGQAVAVIDTGVDYTVSELGGGGFPNSKVVGGTNIGDHTNDPQDCEGHGTSVAAIVAGTAGIAPGAKIVAIKVFAECFPFASDSDIISGIDYAISNKSKYSIGAINMSLGAPISDGSAVGNCDAQEPAFASAINAAKAAGIVVVVASGNNGSSNAISSPACVSAAVSVGAVYSEQSDNVNWGICQDTGVQPDLPACFSDSSSALKLLAPGVFWNVVTKSGDLQSFSGTSAAAPAAAGGVALLRQARPNLSPTAIEGLLTATGVPVRTPSNGVVTPRVDTYAAVSVASANYIPYTGGPVAIPDGSGSASASVTVSGFNAPLGSVLAWVQIDHADPTQLAVRLVGPDGTSVLLHDHTGSPEHPINTVYGRSGASAESLAAFEGKPANGLWTLKVQDTAAGVSGRISNFVLSLLPGQPHAPVPAPLSGGYVIPTVSRTDTDHLSSDNLRIYNPGSTAKTVQIFFVPKGQTGDLAVRSSRTVGAGQVLALNDVLSSEFGYQQASGQLTLLSDDAGFSASSRSFQETSAGTLGTLIPGQLIGNGIGLQPGQNAVLPALTRTPYLHSDAGFTEVSGAPATVRFTVSDADGNAIGSSQQSALPFQSISFPDPIRYLGLGLMSSYRVDASVVNGGSVVPFALTTDDRTGDTAFEASSPTSPPVGPIPVFDRILPYVASSTSGTLVLETDLVLTNTGSAPATVTATITPPATSSVFPGPQTYVVQPGQTLTRPNVLQNDFGYSGAPAAMRLHTDSFAPLAVRANARRVLDSGTYVSTEAATSDLAAISVSSGPATAIHLDQNGQTRSGFGFVEVSGNAALVHVGVIDGATGAELAGKDYNLLPGNEILGQTGDILGSATASNIALQFTVKAGDGKIVAYAVGTDIRSQDFYLVFAGPFVQGPVGPPPPGL